MRTSSLTGPCAAFLCLVAALHTLPGRMAAGPSRPNAPLNRPDDHAWGDYGFMGHRHIHTPHLDRQHLATNIDVWPRLAALLKTSLPDALPGINLTDVNAVAKRRAVSGAQYPHQVAAVDAPTRSLEHRFIMDGWWGMIGPEAGTVTNGSALLYSLQDDPWEPANLAPRESGRARLLSRPLAARWTPPRGGVSAERRTVANLAAGASPTGGDATASGEEGASTESVIYKRVADRALALHIEKPAGWKSTDQRPAIVFFFGGGWVGGSPGQFLKQSRYLATRGMVGLRVEYRTIPKGDPGPPTICCADAKSAMRYVRTHATELGIDPHRIAAAGGSAGGHLAAFTTLVNGLDDPADDRAVSCKAQALLLFNPVFNHGPGQWGHTRVGDRFREFSPAHHVTKDAPPTIVFLGDQDKLIPVATLREFEAAMNRAGVRCDTRVYPGAGHGFFNRDTPKAAWFTQTLIETDKFLASLGWLPGEPTLRLP